VAAREAALSAEVEAARAEAEAVPASEPLALRVLKHSWRGTYTLNLTLTLALTLTLTLTLTRRGTYSRLLRLSPAGTWLGSGLGSGLGI